jgi:hypothetical protein
MVKVVLKMIMEGKVNLAFNTFGLIITIYYKMNNIYASPDFNYFHRQKLHDSWKNFEEH